MASYCSVQVHAGPILLATYRFIHVQLSLSLSSLWILALGKLGPVDIATGGQ